MEAWYTASAARLFEAILSLESVEECAHFFEDICTIKEIQDLTQRLDVAILLQQGKSYQDIAAEVGVSTATISRVNRCLLYGNGGYRTAIEKMAGKEDATNADG